MSVLVVCIHYRSAEATQRYLERLAALHGRERLQVVVVDNSAQDGRFEPRPTALGERVQVATPERNLGYFGGAAFGLRTYVGRHPLPDWVVVSNVDLAFGSSDFLARLEALGGAADLGVVGPAIRSQLTGHDQNPYLRERPAPARMWAYRWLYASYGLYTAYMLTSTAVRHARRALGVQAGRGGPGAPANVYAPHGSFLAFTRAYFERGGTLDYPSFLFGEEIFVAETCRALGLRARYEPGLEVLHEEHVTTGVLRSRRIARFEAESARANAERYFARG